MHFGIKTDIDPEHSAKMVLLGEIASSLVHEINNPLSVIQGATELLRECARHEVADSRRILYFCEIIQNAVARSTKIIQTARSFSRQTLNDPFQTARVSKILEDSVQLSSLKLKASQVRVESIACDDSLEVECRESEICQVLINLISNAADAISSCHDRWIRIEAVDEGNHIGIRITDSGNGIPPGNLDRIFQPFFSTKSIYQGTGLGLSIAQKIMLNHGGSISVDKESLYTRFVVSLPKKRTCDALDAPL